MENVTSQLFLFVIFISVKLISLSVHSFGKQYLVCSNDIDTKNQSLAVSKRFNFGNNEEFKVKKYHFKNYVNIESKNIQTKDLSSFSALYI